MIQSRESEHLSSIVYTLLCSLTCVYEGVFLHVGLLVETFAAVLAGVGPRV